MGNIGPKKCALMTCEETYVRKITGRRKLSKKEVTCFVNTEKMNNLIEGMKELADGVFEDDKDTQPVICIKDQVSLFTSRDISSITSYLAWENEFMDIMKDAANESFNYDLESKRTSSFMRIENNVLTKIIQAFDLGIVAIYEQDISDFLKKTCPKYDSIGYKRKTISGMIKFISELDTSDLQPLEDCADKRRCLQILKQILSLVKRLGTYLSYIIMGFSNKKAQNSKSNEYSCTSLIINCLLKYNFSFYVFAIFLSKIFILKDVNIWIGKKRVQTKNSQAFEDLNYLNKFIASEQDQKLLRNYTMKTIENEVVDEKNYNYLFAHAQINQKKMEMSEFLGHVNHHLKLDLDQIFFSNLSDMLFFFQKIEEFMDKIFQNAELEIKIDLIRVILRVNDSSEFFHRIFIIHMMDLEFLTSCQIFALFNQVVIHSELKIKLKV